MKVINEGGITIQLTGAEAKGLKKFIGATHVNLVEKTLGCEQSEAAVINEILYNLYRMLN